MELSNETKLDMDNNPAEVIDWILANKLPQLLDTISLRGSIVLPASFLISQLELHNLPEGILDSLYNWVAGPVVTRSRLVKWIEWSKY